jgi:3-methyl-2-oxobutanoate hydroxymethyltransferase
MRRGAGLCGMLEGAPTSAATGRGTMAESMYGSSGAAADGRVAVSVADLQTRKGVGPPLVMVTAYDAPGAGMASDAGVDLILVGDSLAMVVLGYENTLSVTVDDMVHHTAAVARARPIPLVVADLPWLSFHLSPAETVANAARLIRAGAGAVKLEGGRKRLPMVEALLDAEIPVMGHIGLTPQSVHAMGGFKVQGRTEDAAKKLVDDARALADAGVFAVVVEGVPAPVAEEVTAAVAVPTIGIGAGPESRRSARRRRSGEGRRSTPRGARRSDGRTSA